MTTTLENSARAVATVVPVCHCSRFFCPRHPRLLADGANFAARCVDGGDACASARAKQCLLA